MEKWKIVAFRQPTSLDIELTADNKILSPKQIWFYAIPNLDKLDLLIFVEHFSDIDENFIIMAIFVLLDAALGEYDVETVIGRLEFHELPEHPKELHLKPFVELPKFVDSWKTLMEY